MDTKHYYLFSFLTLANSCVILLVNIHIDAGFHDTVLNAPTFIDSLVFFFTAAIIDSVQRSRHVNVETRVAPCENNELVICCVAQPLTRTLQIYNVAAN